MNLLEQIFTFSSNNTWLISIVGAILGGEETLIILIVTSLHGVIVLWEVIVFFYIGILISDLIWFYIGRSKGFDYLMKYKYFSNTYHHWGKVLNKASNHNQLRALFLTKFLYGLRIPTILYLAREGWEVSKFIKSTALTNAFWVVIFSAFGYAIGKGIVATSLFSGNIGLSVTATLILLTLLSLAMHKVSRRIKTYFQQ